MLANYFSLAAISTGRTPLKLFLLGVLSCFVNATQLQAGVVFTFAEVGNDVVATTSGSIAAGWNTDGGTLPITSTRGVIAPFSIRGEVNGGVRFTASDGYWTNNNQLVGVPQLLNGTVTGDTFGFSSTGNFYASAGTNVGDAITPNTTITWANQTFTTMKLDNSLSTTPLTLFTLNNGETISAALSSGGAAVPEPSSLAMLGCGAVVASGYRRWRSKKKV